MNQLKQIERDVLRLAREWARTELEKQLQRQADEMEMICLKSGECLSNTRYRKMTMRTVPGIVRLRVRIGYSPKKRGWVNPARQTWGLAPYQQVSPELQARVCQTALPVGKAAALSARGEHRVGAFDGQCDVAADERERRVRAQRARQQARLGQDLEAVADTEHEPAGLGERDHGSHHR